MRRATCGFGSALEALSSLIWLIDLIKHSSVGKMDLLRFLPVPDDFSEREQLHLGKLVRVFPGRRFGPRTVIAFRGDLLALRAIEIFEVRLRNCAGALLIDNPVDQAYRRFAENAH